MFGLNMDVMVEQLTQFKAQAERMVAAVEKTQRDIDQIKKHLGVVEDQPQVEKEDE